VTCDTDIACVVRVQYGTTTAYGLETADTASGTSHSRTLAGLTANTTYHYRVRADSG
jgi:phosphodiesterase/alkaline phosphatase D-like protein